MDRVILLDLVYLAATVTIMILSLQQMWRSSTSTERGKTHYQRNKRKSLSGMSAILDYIWRKQYRLAIGIVAILGSWVVLYADNILMIDNIPPKDELSSLALVITGAIVFWSTREAYDLKNISQDAKRLQQTEFDYENRPYIRMQWSKNRDEVLHIVNEGKGLARDLTFEPLELEKGVAFAPLRRPVIAAGGYTVISQTELQKGAGKGDINGYGDYDYDVRDHMDQYLKDGTFGKIHIVYRDLRDQVYDAYFTPDERYNDRFNIESQTKR